MRDHLKDIEYFRAFIDEEVGRIAKFSRKLANGEVKAERVRPVKAKIHDLRLGVLIARYSRGDDLKLLEQEYLSLVAGWAEVWDEQYYNKNLQMASLAVLFHVNEAVLDQVKRIMARSQKKDWLFEFLLYSSEAGTASVGETLLFPKAFSTLQRIVKEERKPELLRQYLSDEWYGPDCGCYEAHRSNQNVYYGYWSFEAGAVAKILKIEDSCLENQRYYPYHLVHYKE